MNSANVCELAFVLEVDVLSSLFNFQPFSGGWTSPVISCKHFVTF